MIRSYPELLNFTSFEQRFDYLKLNGSVAHSTFGGKRQLGRAFYTSPEWRRVRREVILRDSGCDLGCPDFPVHGKIFVHHINPITADDVIRRHPAVLDPDNLITVSFDTHNAIHYGDYSLVDKDVVERRPFDTTPWLGGRRGR